MTNQIMYLRNIQTNKLGPGAYVGHQEYRANRSAAPFNTQVARNVPKKESEILPGPGAYYHDKSIDG